MEGATPLSVIERHREQARERLDPATWRYLEAGAERGISASAAEAAWARIALRPHILKGIREVDTGTTLFGEPIDLPVLTAPNGRATRFSGEGELDVLNGVAAAGSIALLPSSVAWQAAALTARAPEARFWQQLYLGSDRAYLRDLLASLRAAGALAIVVTADLLPAGTPLPAPAPATWERAVNRQVPDNSYTGADLEDLAFLCAEAAIPVVVKGVLRGDDAMACVDAGAAGLIVSNHGGNQLDTALASAEALIDVVAACAGRAEILVDGGIRSGTAILKALALGARAILVGRPVSYALAAGGGAAVTEMLNSLREELARSMALCGVGDVAALDVDLLRLGVVPASPIR